MIGRNVCLAVKMEIMAVMSLHSLMVFCRFRLWAAVKENMTWFSVLSLSYRQQASLLMMFPDQLFVMTGDMDFG